MLPPPTLARPLRWTSLMSHFLVAAAVAAVLAEAAPEDASWLGKRLASSGAAKNSRPKDLYSFGIGESVFFVNFELVGLDGRVLYLVLPTWSTHPD